MAKPRRIKGPDTGLAHRAMVVSLCTALLVAEAACSQSSRERGLELGVSWVGSSFKNCYAEGCGFALMLVPATFTMGALVGAIDAEAERALRPAPYPHLPEGLLPDAQNRRYVSLLESPTAGQDPRDAAPAFYAMDGDPFERRGLVLGSHWLYEAFGTERPPGQGAD